MSRTTTDRLAREWQHLNLRPTALAQAARWNLLDHPPRSLDEVVVAVGAGGDRSPEADRRLRRLVSFAGEDELAARVVVQRLTPGLLAGARRHRMGPDGFEEMLAAAWIAVRTYNPSRSPSNIASALISDAEYAAWRRQRKRLARTDASVEVMFHDTAHADVASSTGHASPSDELADIVASVAPGELDAGDLDLLQRLLTTPSTTEVAIALNVTSRTIRNRRDRLTAKLREAALVAV